MRRVLKLATLVLAALVAPSALAAPSPINTTFKVTASVVKSCTVTTQDLALGNYDPLSATDLAPGTAANVTVTCSKGTQATVAAMTTANSFTMKSASTTGNLTYKLYQDAAHTKDWSALNWAQTSTSALTGLVYTVYGVVAHGQDAAVAADYTDTVNVSVTF